MENGPFIICFPYWTVWFLMAMEHYQRVSRKYSILGEWERITSNFLLIYHGSVCSEMGQKHRNVGSRKASTTDGSPILISSCLNRQWSSNQARTRYDKFCRIYLFESPASQQEKCETVRNLTEMKRCSPIQRSLMFILILTSVILTTITLSSVESFHLWICIATSFSNYQWEGKHVCQIGTTLQACMPKATGR